MSHPSYLPSEMNRRVELALLLVILLVAAFLRFYRLDSVPPGPSHDELRMMDLGELIVEGARPIHWTISYSAEPFYMYLLALAMPIWGFTPFGARIVTRFAGLLLIPLVHRLTRRLFDRRVALVASGVLAVTWWPLFFSRIALRGITLPLVFTAAVYCLWRGFDKLNEVEPLTTGGFDKLNEVEPLTTGGFDLEGKGATHSTAKCVAPWGVDSEGKDATLMTASRRVSHMGWLIVGGALMGFTWYTFTAARGLVILLPLVLGHLALTRRVRGRQLWRVGLVTIGAAALVIAPFVYDMQVNPGAPEARLGQLNEVIDALKSGNPLPFIRQATNTMGLFLWRGDPNWRYNVSCRPALGPVLGVLALLGLLVGIARWRQPSYFALVAWLLLGLAPSMLTPEAPSFVRAIGALPVTAIMPGIGAAALWDWLVPRVGPRAERAVPGLLAILLALNGLFTCRTQFFLWPTQPAVREIYQATLSEAFRALNRSDLEGPLWISEPFPDDRHLLLAKRLLEREAIEPRWFDAGRALILPPADGVRRYLLADFVVPDSTLFARWMSEAVVVLEGRPSAPGEEPPCRVYQVEGGSWVTRELSEIAIQSTASLDLEGRRPVALPARFGERAMLLGYELKDDRLTPGDDVHLIVYWRVRGPVYEPLASFAHLLDGQHNIVGQYDGFDVPPWHWEPGAVVAQVYRFPISQDAQPGVHWLEVGLYNSQTMERLNVVDETGVPLGDRLVLQEATLQ